MRRRSAATPSLGAVPHWVCLAAWPSGLGLLRQMQGHYFCLAAAKIELQNPIAGCRAGREFPLAGCFARSAKKRLGLGELKPADVTAPAESTETLTLTRTLP